MKLRNALATGVLMAIGSATCAATAATVPGIYGEIDTHRFPQPQLISAKPVVITAPRKHSAAKPIYLHVAPGDEWHWFNRCRVYGACAEPVYFVTENWFLSVYLPAIGSRDGREQTYRAEAARERAAERDRHDPHGTD
jgi:hypothetical protein